MRCLRPIFSCSVAVALALVTLSWSGEAAAQVGTPGRLRLALSANEGLQEWGEDGSVSPGLAALASLAVPGAGQIITGRKWGWGLVVADAMLIGSTVWARSEGRDRQDKYEAFARQHWDRQRYLDYLTFYLGQTGTSWPHVHHTLPPADVMNHDYYEMIGKYDQFAPGWNDWTASGALDDGSSTYRSRYLDMRWRANRYLKWSLTAGGVVFLNHAFAAVEALIWGTKQQISTPSLGLRIRGVPGEGGETLLTITWRVGR